MALSKDINLDSEWLSDRSFAAHSRCCDLASAALEGLFLIARTKLFKWVDTMLGNVKNAIRGTYHAVAPKHLPRYRAEFCWRFNRRFDLASLLTRLAIVATRTPHALLTHKTG